MMKFFGGQAQIKELPSQDNMFGKIQLLCFALGLFVSHISVWVAKRFKRPENHYVLR